MSEASEEPWKPSKVFQIYQSKEELLVASQAVASNISGCAFSAVLELYYVVRYLVAIFEVRFRKVPLQVWNEHRMALDHFMRHVAGTDQGQGALDDGHHVRRMRGHMFRAALDMCKLLSYDSDAELEETIRRWGVSTLAQIRVESAGMSLLEVVLSKKNEASALLAQAKLGDFSMGQSGDDDRDVLGRYLDAVFSYANALDIIFEHRHQLESLLPTDGILDHEQLELDMEAEVSLLVEGKA